MPLFFLCNQGEVGGGGGGDRTELNGLSVPVECGPGARALQLVSTVQQMLAWVTSIQFAFLL